MAENGKWQLAFWILGTICGLWLSGLTASVVANDRLTRDRENSMMNCVHTQYQEVIQRLTRIETKLEK